MTDEIPRDERLDVDDSLVPKLVADQFPQWEDLPIRQVAVNGWDREHLSCTGQVSHS